MCVNDPIGDMITRMRNGQTSAKRSVVSPHSKFRESVLEVLKNEGYIRGFYTEELRPNIKQLVIELKYAEGKPVISAIQKKSTPGRRLYVPANKIAKVANGLGISILSTSKGVMSDVVARAQGVGGEQICTVF